MHPRLGPECFARQRDAASGVQCGLLLEQAVQEQAVQSQACSSQLDSCTREKGVGTSACSAGGLHCVGAVPAGSAEARCRWYPPPACTFRAPCLGVVCFPFGCVAAAACSPIPLCSPPRLLCLSGSLCVWRCIVYVLAGFCWLGGFARRLWVGVVSVLAGLALVFGRVEALGLTQLRHECMYAVALS